MRAPYVRTYAILLALLAATVAVAHFHLGRAGIAITLGIAGVKAALIVLHFMHVSRSSALVKLFVAAGVFWLALLVLHTMSDYLSR